MFNQLFAGFNILSHQQLVFQGGKSCADAVGQLWDFIYWAIYDKKYISFIFLDLRKSYDTVNHRKSLDKLEAYGIRNWALNCFKIYLNSRIQHVRIGDTVSEANKVTIGIPPGSVLGGLIFLIFINDLLVFMKVFLRYYSPRMSVFFD